MKDKKKNRSRLAKRLMNARHALRRLKQVEAHYEELATFLDSVFENIPDMVFVKDAKELRFIRFNRAGEQLLGLSKKDLAGKNDHDFFPPEQAKFFEAKDREVLNFGSLVDIPEEPIETPKGTRILHTKKIPILDDKGNPLYLLGISEDITERKKIEEALRSERAYIEHLVSAAPVLICGIEPEGTANFANQAVSDVTGYSNEEIVGKNWWDLFYPGKERQQVTQLFRDFEKGAVVNYEMALTTKSGEKKIISWNSVNRFDKNGKLVEIIGIGANVTENKKLEALVFQSEKLSSVGQLAAGVAHEINNPLGVILGFAQVGVSRLPSDHTLIGPLKSIEREAIRCRELVQNLLVFSRSSKMDHRETFNPLQTIEEALSLITAEAKFRNVQMVKTVINQEIKISANKNQIQQIVVNLCSNALDAMPDGGKLDIKIDVVKREGKNWLLMEYADTGRGMSKEVKQRLFEPFFTTKAVGKGTGLGLSLVFEIVKKHGGLIEVSSEEGKGARFSLYLPTAN